MHENEPYGETIQEDKELDTFIRATTASSSVLPFILKSLTVGKVNRQIGHPRNLRDGDFNCILTASCSEQRNVDVTWARARMRKLQGK